MCSSDLVQALTGVDLSGIKYYSFGHGEVAGVRATISRTGYTGEDGFELLLGAEAGLALWHHCLESGVQPCGLGARDTLRLEAAMHLYGSDMDTTTTPLEVGLGWLVHLEMPKPFIGREVLEQQTATGAPRRLVEIGRAHV